MVPDPNSPAKFSGVTATSLLAQLRANDPEGWQRLVDLFGPLIYNWCRTMKVQAADIDDISQLVFQKVTRKIDGFRRERNGDTFHGWLWTITRNQVRDHYRGQARRADAAGGTDFQQRMQQIPEAPPDSRADAPSDENSVVQRALQLIRSVFSEQTWEAFFRLTTGKQTAAEIADGLGMSKKAVRQAKYRVLTKLRAEFGELLDLP